MPEPNEYLIVRNLQAALQAISVAGGYYYDLGALAVKLDPNQDVESLVAPGGPRPFIVIDVQPDEWVVAGSRPNNRLTRTMPINIHWVSDSSPTTDESKLQTFMRGVADVEKAVAVDRTFGQLAHESLITSATASQAIDSALVWAIIAFRITVMRTYGRPS